MKKLLTGKNPYAGYFTLMISCLVVLMASCRDENLETAEEKSSTAIMHMQYTVTKTTFVRDGSDTPSPSVTKEKIDMEVYEGDEFQIRVDILDDEAISFHKSESVPGNDYPIASYYLMEKGKYRMYDTKGNIMHENDMPELDFTGLTENLRNYKGNIASLPSTITGGMLFLPMTGGGDDLSPNSRTEKSKYGNDYEVFEQSYQDEFDGKMYRQEAIVSKKDQTLQVMHLFDHTGKLISKTVYRYEGSGDNITLKNTQDTFVDYDGEGNELVFNTLSEYDNFSINLNLSN